MYSYYCHSMRYLGILFCLFSFGTAEELLDVETLATLRTQQYPMEPYKKIVIYSAQRTGSTLAYNVFKYLFENQNSLFCSHHKSNQDCFVSKTHQPPSLKDSNATLIVITIRNPADAIISAFRKESQKDKINIRI